MVVTAERGAARNNDRAEIRDLLHRLSRAVDRKRWTDIPALATADAVFDYGIFKGNAAELVLWMQGRHENIERSFHALGSTLVEFTGGRALCESYVVSSQRIANPAFASGQMDVLANGRYVDVFRKDGAWLLERRHFILDNSIVTEALKADASAMNIGRRDESDILWAERARLGLS